MMAKRVFVQAALGLLLAAAPGFTADKVLGLETGYAYLASARDVAPQVGSGVLANLYFGFEVGDNPRRSSLLSLALGYAVFPYDTGLAALHDAVFGLEYAHTFFYGKPVGLMLDGAMMADLLVQAGGTGYAFGHRTRLGFGPVFRLSRRDSLALQVTYNFIIFPHLDQPTDLFHIPGVVLRYQFRF